MSEHIQYLLKYDTENNTELTQTLLKFLECKFNISETAKGLYIHRNTLINRMNKIKELLYDDLESMDTLIPFPPGRSFSKVVLLMVPVLKSFTRMM